MAVPVLALIVLAGCNGYTVELEAPAPLLPTHTLRVGAAREEITPVPGLPMGGYGFIGQTARGVWTRLYANALVLEDGAGTPLVLVSCDLWSMPGGLADAVAARVQADPRGIGLGRAHMIIAATHTHQSPGAYSSSIAYNTMASPEGRYDPALFDFLATRISRAILRAAAARAPVTMHWRDGHLARFVRNRAFPAFVRNPERETVDFLAPESAAPYCDLRTPVRARAACRAVDATVTVVRFERDERIVAAAVFAALHPTAAGPGLALYSSDVFGIAGIHAARQLTAGPDGAAPVLAFFNGAEGDVSPDWRTQDGPNALTLGRRLGQAVVELAAGGRREDAVAIAYAFERFELAGACRAGGTRGGSDDARRDGGNARGQDAGGPDDDGPRCAATRPRVGRATLAGATDGRTHFLPWLFRAGVTRTPLGPQGVKVPALDPGIGWLRLPLTALALLPVRGPSQPPLGVYQLGPLAIATLPGEFTTMMGRRIAQGVARALPGAERVLLAGLANAYLSYFTTPEEYGGQFYEGSSTLYGPASGPVIGDALARLAGDAARGRPAHPPARETIAYTPGPVRHFGLADVEPPHTANTGLEPLLYEPPYAEGPPYPSVCWTDAAPAFPDVRFPAVALEAATSVGPEADAWAPLAGAHDSGTDVITVVSGRTDGRADWRALWLPPPGVVPGARYRFAVTPVDGSPVHGTPFTLEEPTSVPGCDTAR